MHSAVVAGIIFASAFGGALLGMFFQRRLPESHLRPESKEVIKLGTGLIATMAALVLGLLVGAAKSSFDAERTGFQQLALNIVLLDRTLAHYGPEAQPAREQLRKTVKAMIDSLWPSDNSAASDLGNAKITESSGAVYAAVRDLAPRDDAHRWLQNQAMQTSVDLAKNRWQLVQKDEGSLPLPFLAVRAFWLLVLFTSFGLFAPSNGTVIAMLLICALSVAGAVFLIIDLDQPFDGLVQIPSSSLRDALANLNQ